MIPKLPLSSLTVWPAGQPQPDVSTLSATDGQVVSNAAIVSAGTDGAGSVTVAASDATDVILDINGYFLGQSDGTTDSVPASGTINGVPVSEFLNIGDPGLRNWVAAIARAKSSVVNVAIFGDSLSACYQPACGETGPSAATLRYADQLRAYFTSQGLSHGTGIIPVVLALPGPGINSGFWTLNGSWSQSSIIGPVQQGYPTNNGGAVIKMPPGSTAAMKPQTGDTLAVYCAEYLDSTSGLTVAIDGVNVGTACGSTSSSAAAQVATFSVSTGLGSHTATLTSNATGNAYLYGAEWRVGNSGISIHNLAVAAVVAEFFGTNVSTQLAFSDLIGGGTQLAITLLGTNEPGLGASVDSYQASLTNLVQHEQNLGASVLIIAPPPLGTSVGGQLPAYQAAAHQIAINNGTAYLDFTRWGTFSQANANQLYQSDGVHLNDNGQNDLFQMIAQSILGYNTSTSSSFNGGTINNPLSINESGSIAVNIVNPVSTQVSATMYGSNSCNSNHAFWQGQTGAGYTYSVPNAFVLFDCLNGEFPFLVFPSGDISISGTNFGYPGGTGTVWPTPVDQGASLQVTGGLNSDTLKLASSSSQPICTVSLRGTFWFVQSPSGSADHLQVCAKDASDSYSWVKVF